MNGDQYLWTGASKVINVVKPTPCIPVNSRPVNHRADLKKAGDKRDEVYARLEAEYLNLQNPVRTANKFGIEEIIDPADTRSLVCAWVKHMQVSDFSLTIDEPSADEWVRYEQNLAERLQQRACGNIKPSFR